MHVTFFVVAGNLFLRGGFDDVGRDFFIETECELEIAECDTRVTTRKFREIVEGFRGDVFGFFKFRERAFQNCDHVIAAERLEHEDASPREKWGNDFEARIFGRRADERDET